MAKTNVKGKRLCDSGLHHMDPNWTVCPYCDAESKSKKRTESVEPAFSASQGEDEPSLGRRKTAVMPTPKPQPSQGVSNRVGENRRIVGVLITYTWHRKGEIYPILEGKNFIGAGTLVSEASHRECDIYVAQDPELSGEHALILCRHGKYQIFDQKTTNGSFVSGEEVPLQGMELPNYAEIKTGTTHWTFIKIQPPKGEKIPSPRPSKPEEDKTVPEKDSDYTIIS